MIYLLWLHKTAFCSKLAWQARGEITLFKPDSCSAVVLRFFSCADVRLAVGAVNLFRVKPCLSCAVVRNLKSLPKHACTSWGRYNYFLRSWLYRSECWQSTCPGISHSACFPNPRNINCSL